MNLRVPRGIRKMNVISLGSRDKCPVGARCAKCPVSACKARYEDDLSAALWLDATQNTYQIMKCKNGLHRQNVTLGYKSTLYVMPIMLEQ